MQFIEQYVRCFLLFLIIVPGTFVIEIKAQQPIDVDLMFEKAREHAADGEYEEARLFARTILDVTPEYYEVRIFLARIFAWENRFSEARSELSFVLEENPRHVDALSARADIELWDRNYQAGLEFVNRAISQDNKNPELYVKRARLSIGLQRYAAASSDLEKAESLDPQIHEISRLLHRQIDHGQKRNITAFGLSYDHLGDGLEPWQRVYGEYHRVTNSGPVIGRLTIGSRVNIIDWQAEADAYPAFGQYWYAYLNAGVSGGDLFPDFRAGAEFYRILPRGFEGSLGMRYLQFSDDEVYIFTISMSKYWRRWFLTIRPFLTPQDAGLSMAMNGVLRRYFGDPDTYASLNGGFGFSPDERRILDGNPDRRLLKSRYIGLNGYYLFRDRIQLFGELKATDQQFPFFEYYTRIYTFETGVKYRF